MNIYKSYISFDVHLQVIILTALLGTELCEVEIIFIYDISIK